MLKKIVFLTLIFASILSSCISNHEFSRKEIKKRSDKVSSQNFKNLFKINQNIFRSEQPKNTSDEELSILGIKSILNLRDDISDSAVLSPINFELYNVKMDARKVDENQVKIALEIIKNAPKPILIHCKHGSDRTGLIIAMYRITEENWTRENAIFEMKRGGFGFHDKYQNIPRFIRNCNLEELK